MEAGAGVTSQRGCASIQPAPETIEKSRITIVQHGLKKVNVVFAVTGEAKVTTDVTEETARVTETTDVTDAAAKPAEPVSTQTTCTCTRQFRLSDAVSVSGPTPRPLMDVQAKKFVFFL